MIRPLMPHEAKRLGVDWFYSWGRKANKDAGREVLLLSRRTIGSAIGSIALMRRYNLGNHIRQVANAIRFAESHSVPSIILPQGSIFAPGKVGEVSVLPFGSDTPGNRLYGDFFYYDRLGFTESSLDRGRVLRLMRPLLSAAADVATYDDSSLVIHLRGGDSFSRNPHPLYAPPPVRYFTQAIERSACSKVVVVAQELTHPQLPVVRSKCASLGLEVEVHSSDLMQDFSKLMGAKRLCVSQGTLALAAAWLSPNCTEVFAFNRNASEIQTLRELKISVEHCSLASTGVGPSGRPVDSSSLTWKRL